MNSLKSFVKTIADKAGSEFSPVRSQSRDDDLSEGAGATGDDEQEGFICPSCMRGFVSPELLQVHYEASHSSEASFVQAKKNEGHFADLKDEVSRVQSTLKEEQLYSTELKREVERLSNAVVQAGQKRAAANHEEGEEEEKCMYKEQVRALQEGKILLSQEVLALRQQLVDSQLTAKEKEKLIDKAAQLAAENVALKAAVDEITGQRAATEERLKMVENDLRQRNSTDDAAVLRQELVTVQTMMDNLTMEKERELSGLKRQYDALQSSVFSGQVELAKEIRSLSTEKVELLKSVQQTTQQVAILKDSLGVKENKNVDLERQLEEARQELSRRSQEITSLKGRADSLEAEKQKLVHSHASGDQKLQTQLDQLREHSSVQETRVRELNEEMLKLQSDFGEQNQENDDLKSQLHELRGNLEETQRHLHNRESELSKSAEKVKTIQEELSRAKEEKIQLMEKMEAGDGAISTALAQLTQQNESLSAQLEQSSQEGKKSVTDLQGKIDSLHNQLHECQNHLKKANEKASKAEQQSTDKQGRLENLEKVNAKLETDLRHKTEHLVTSESEKCNQRLDFDESLKLAQTAHEEKASKLVVKIGELEAQLHLQDKLRNEMENERTAKETEMSRQADKIVKLEEASRQIDNCNKSLEEELTSVKTARELLQEKNVALAKECSAANDKYRNSEQLVTSLREELAIAAVAVSNHERERSEMSSQLLQKEAEVKELGFAVESLRKVESEIRTRLQTASDKEKELLSIIEDQLGTMSSLKREAQSKVEGKDEEIQALQANLRLQEEHLEKVQAEKQVSEEERVMVEEKICQLQSLRESEKCSLEEEVGDLRRAKELLLEAKVEMQGRLDESEAKVLKAEATARDVQNQLAKRENDLKEEMGKMKSVIKEQSASHQAAILKREQEAESLRAEILVHQGTSSEKAAEASKLHSKLTELDKQLDAALSDRLELEAKIGSANDERRSLLERCLEAENELEKSRGTIVELRRKLDDSQSALHELGRENQSIQVELAKQTGRKWVDDSQCQECSACSSQFSLRNRKHHCRNCLQIFCAECSSKQAQMAHSKKPQRVCDQCYSELHQPQVQQGAG